MRSLFQLLRVALPVPDPTPLSRRGGTVQVSRPKRATGALHLVFNSRGLKRYGAGEGEARQQGRWQRRTWRKVHLTVDGQSDEIQAVAPTEAGGLEAEAVAPLLERVGHPLASATGEGSYDWRNVYPAVQAHRPGAQVAMPPCREARIWPQGNCQAPPYPRDENWRTIRRHGRYAWKREAHTHRRSLAGTTVFRLGTIFDDRLSAGVLATPALRRHVFALVRSIG